jgi:hypothetical protein
MLQITDPSEIPAERMASYAQAAKAAEKILPALVESLSMKMVNGRPLGAEQAAAHVLLTLFTAVAENLRTEFGQENIQ